MTNKNLLYLDVLPVHPRPLPLESLNSYIKRLAQANDIHHINAFSQLTMTGKSEFLLNKPHRTLFERLRRLTICSETQLLALTFHHLGWKFGRHQSLGRFLRNSISPFVRYCPTCLDEQKYFSLTWSFLRLFGCPQHSLHLLDICGHCGQHIPLKNPCLSLTNCHFCGGDLRLSATTKLSSDEHQLCLQHQDDLVYLLTEQPWQKTQPEIAAATRQRLASIRSTRGIDAQDVARQLRVKNSSLLAIENEAYSGSGEVFQDYLLYADYFNLPLSHVFIEAAQTGYIPKGQLRRDAFLAKVQLAVGTLKQQGTPVTYEKVAHLVGCNVHTLRHHPTVHAWLRNEALQRKQRTPAHKMALFQSAKQIIFDLNAQGKRISYRAIGFRLGRDPAQIKHIYPDVDALIRQAIVEQRQQQKNDLVIQVENTIHALVERQQRITTKSVARFLCISPATLYRYPAIQALVNEERQRIEHLEWHDTSTKVKQVVLQPQLRWNRQA